MDPKLTLEDAKRKARQREAVSGQQDIVQDTGATPKNVRVEPVAKTKLEELIIVRARAAATRTIRLHQDRALVQKSALAAAGGNTPGRNVQLEKLCATLVRNEGTIAPNASKEHNSVLQG